jgi:hypothetical protein
MEKSETLNIRSLEMPKCEHPKRHITQNVEYWDFGYQEMERQGSFVIRSPEVQKREMPKTPEAGTSYRDLS